MEDIIEDILNGRDLWIASVARQHGLKVFSKDQHFKYISGLMLIS
jgi:tRNA(fMet)-specific endonuclease VapC